MSYGLDRFGGAVRTNTGDVGDNSRLSVKVKGLNMTGSQGPLILEIELLINWWNMI
ncbi:hypothetical protein ES703_57037 [subsurface metagenome]